jgi:hypothetical protein
MVVVTPFRSKQWEYSASFRQSIDHVNPAAQKENYQYCRKAHEAPFDVTEIFWVDHDNYYKRRESKLQDLLFAANFLR